MLHVGVIANIPKAPVFIDYILQENIQLVQS
jgi:hypothetical protein